MFWAKQQCSQPASFDGTTNRHRYICLLFGPIWWSHSSMRVETLAFDYADWIRRQKSPFSAAGDLRDFFSSSSRSFQPAPLHSLYLYLYPGPNWRARPSAIVASHVSPVSFPLTGRDAAGHSIRFLPFEIGWQFNSIKFSMRCTEAFLLYTFHANTKDEMDLC